MHNPRYSIGMLLHTDDLQTPITLRVMDLDLSKERYLLQYISVPDRYRQFLGKIQSEDMKYFESTEWKIIFLNYNEMWNNLNAC